MHRLLIVDDESYILNSLVDLFERCTELELEVHSARSSAEALRILGQVRIDIVLADIQMPGMTGLELSVEIGRLWPYCRIIFLSAYDEFEYVQQAIRQGSVDYLLKTEDNGVIVQAVQRAASQLSETWEKETVVASAQLQMNEALPLLRQEYLRRLLSGPPASAACRRVKFNRVKLPLDADQPIVLVCGRVDDWGKYRESDDRDLMKYAIQNIAQEYLVSVQFQAVHTANRRFSWLIQSKEGLLNGQGSDGGSGQDTELGRYVQNNLDAIQATCRKLLELPLSFISTMKPLPWEALPDKFDLLNRQLFQGLGKGAEAILIEAEKQAKDGSQDAGQYPGDLERRVNQLRSYMQALRQEEFAAGFGELADAACSLGVPGYLEIRARLFALLLNMWQELESAAPSVADPEWEQLASPHSSDSRKESLAVLLRQFERWFECKLAASADPAQELVSRINLHVMARLDQDLSVASLSRMVFLNPDYLSRLYKQTTGVNLYDYITGIKVEESRRLLRDTDLKIHEVAEKVGILSREYFSRFIRKHTGMTPQELRDKRR
ncbi:MAG: hypothetical protein K0R57_222 [Paenibacillaceae bacterium]|jgi:two-component system response regulator YesN|nr:hypothetical protein [Paenibacillaceae bacterium]